MTSEVGAAEVGRDEQELRITEYVAAIRCRAWLTIRLCSMHVDVLDIVVDHMDMETVLTWRNTCRFTYEHAVTLLRRALLRLLGRHLPSHSLVLIKLFPVFLFTIPKSLSSMRTFSFP